MARNSPDSAPRPHLVRGFVGAFVGALVSGFVSGFVSSSPGVGTGPIGIPSQAHGT
ncbi:hypothetical protein [Terrabacter terrigena]|uniref:Uncharacterized protein n=1 Tax=Terrabacter terrigena TaxID=574718 RepID=A0ABW3MTB2_9MICO